MYGQYVRANYEVIETLPLSNQIAFVQMNSPDNVNKNNLKKQ